MKCDADWKFKQNVDYHCLINQRGAPAVLFVRILGRNVFRARNDDKCCFVFFDIVFRSRYERVLSKTFCVSFRWSFNTITMLI